MGIIDRERVWTESAFLERTDDGDFVRYYIEADDGALVKDVFEEVLAETADEVLVELQERLGEAELVEADLLYHLVHPERPRVV